MALSKPEALEIIKIALTSHAIELRGNRTANSGTDVTRASADAQYLLTLLSALQKDGTS